LYENKPRAINNEQKEKIKYTVHNCLTTKEPQEALNMKTKVELNHQNRSLVHQQSNIKEEEETCIIPGIING
jgi:transposase